MNATITSLRAEVAELRKIIEKQSAEIERLKARKPKTSRTSSKPPSTDGPRARGAAKSKP